MKRILISGYYGFNNSGDEAILRLMLDNLRTKLPDAEVTVLSHNPTDTASRYGVRAADRMNPLVIVREVMRCSLLISGGGSLIQDVTSRRSPLYYLSIIDLAKLFRKKVFVYSQGIGPLRHSENRKHTAKTLARVDGIVVRDRRSKDLLQEIGLNVDRVTVTADPVIRAARPELARGEEILLKEGCLPRTPGKIRVAWAVKADAACPDFVERQREAIRWLIEERNADVVLIPFHEAQDMGVATAISQEFGENVGLLAGHYLSEDLLSVVGNFDVLVGARLHALIYAAVMGVPMIGISYDPKIDSFLESLGLAAISDVSHFSLAGFREALEELLLHRQALCEQIQERVKQNQETLDINEQQIAALLGE